jgi:hypothetical protein
MKTISCLALVLASYALADEATDRAAIERTIGALNQVPRPAGLFAENASSELDQLPNVKPLRAAVRPGDVATTVVISDQPWREATIVIAPPGVEILNPHFASTATRFITGDVALADGTWTHMDNASTQTIRLLFVMKKEGDARKIASIRFLAAH